MTAELLSRRFANDGVPAIAMTAVQEEARREILTKLRNGVYRMVAVPCQACGSETRKLLAEKDSAGIPIDTSICLSCGLVYASRRFDDRSLAEFYRDENLRLDRGVTAAEEFLFNLEIEKGETLFAFLDAQGLLEGRQGGLVTEIGCGAGGILLAFKKRGFEVAGFDIDESVINYGSKQKGLDLYCGDADRAREVFAEMGKQPTLVICEQSLEHFTDLNRELGRVKALMAPGTLLFIGVPGLRNLGDHYNFDFLNYLQPGHLVHFERRTLCNVLGAHGFEPVIATEHVKAVFKIGDSANRPENASYTTDIAHGMIAFLRALERKWRQRSVMTLIRRIGRAGIRLLTHPVAFLMSRRRRAGI